MMQKLHETAETVHSDMRLTSALALYAGCGDTLLCLSSTEHRPPTKKTSKRINNIWEKRAEMPLCPHSVALVHSGEGHWKKEN